MALYGPEVIASFSEKYPQITIDITTTDGLVNLIDDAFDIVLRYGTLPDSRSIATRLTRFERIVCAAPSYLERFGEVTELQSLLHHQCVVHRENDPASWSFRKGDQLFHQPVRARIEVDNAVAAAQLCIAGAGLARLTLPTMQRDLDAGRLVHVLPGYECVEPADDKASLWLVHISRDLPHRVRLLVDHLRREIPRVRKDVLELR
jgi:DNA-binding transcriptional LysR family regulator